ncbi:hypothetical protein E2320_007474 [Naja naja]|nr:hypothetical protein E2320_007474 [Naja naja]
MDYQTAVVTQPQVVVTMQPNTNYWQTDLCDCFSDIGVYMNECCCCGSSVTMRAVYRTKYNIPGSICDDTLIVGFCPVLSLCQIQRDINKRKEMGIF